MSFAGVYDGHGGDAVAQWLPGKLLTNMSKAWRGGAMVAQVWARAREFMCVRMRAGGGGAHGCTCVGVRVRVRVSVRVCACVRKCIKVGVEVCTRACVREGEASNACARVATVTRKTRTPPPSKPAAGRGTDRRQWKLTCVLAAFSAEALLCHQDGRALGVQHNLLASNDGRPLNTCLSPQRWYSD
eukprot:336339-Chlamydomonas_euryale.AAC.1